jgi:hypothetical protein
MSDMSDALQGIRDLLTMIPVTVRRIIYGLLAVVVLLDSVIDVLPDDVSEILLIVFGLFAPVMALANTTSPPPPPPPEPAEFA